MNIMARCRNSYRKTLSFSLRPTASTSALPTTSASQMNLQTAGKSTQLSDFEVIGLIGKGAFGKVYSVNHRPLRTMYALKCLSKRRLVQKCMGTSILKELEMSELLNHTFIVRLWFTFQDESYIYIISDLLTGGDLRVHLNMQGRFSEPRVKLYACEIALALDYLHKRGIAHRDLKPENILLDSGGHAHLADLNLAIRLNDFPDGLATSFTGTRLYMAPEVLLTALCESVGYDHRVDWWSFGVCFFEMLHGRRPFEFPAFFSSTQVLRLLTSNFDVPAHWTSDLRAFIAGLLCVSPTRRIDCLERFHKHEYMERINLNHVLYRQTAPMFVPTAGSMPRVCSDNLYANEESAAEKRLRNSSPLSLRLQRGSSNNSGRQSGSVTANRFKKLPNTTDGMNANGAGDCSLKRVTRYFSTIGGSDTVTRRASTPWSAELAHLTLSFREFNRFCAPSDTPNGDQLYNGDETSRQPRAIFDKHSTSGLLLSQSVRALENEEARARSRTPPYVHQENNMTITNHFIQQNALYVKIQKL